MGIKKIIYIALFLFVLVASVGLLLPRFINVNKSKEVEVISRSDVKNYIEEIHKKDDVIKDGGLVSNNKNDEEFTKMINEVEAVEIKEDREEKIDELIEKFKENRMNQKNLKEMEEFGRKLEDNSEKILVLTEISETYETLDMFDEAKRIEKEISQIKSNKEQGEM